jgi:hypothetical protein
MARRRLPPPDRSDRGGLNVNVPLGEEEVMPFARLVEFEPTDEKRNAVLHDAVVERLNVAADPPDGVILHSAGFGEDGTFRVYDVWESRDQAERFENERLFPAIEEVAGEDFRPPVKRETYELHNTFIPG